MMNITQKQYDQLVGFGFRAKHVGDHTHPFAEACLNCNQLTDLIDLETGAIATVDSGDMRGWGGEFSEDELNAAIAEAISGAMYWFEDE